MPLSDNSDNVEKRGLSSRSRPPVVTLIAMLLITTVLLLLVIAMIYGVLFVSFFIADDPFQPRPPYYEYEASIIGLEGFSTESGSATIMLPLPAVNDTPLLEEGWWLNYNPDFREKRHGMTGLKPANTTRGYMLTAHISMTDYYLSSARVTPVPITPGQNITRLPAVVEDRIDKPLSFDDVYIIASGGVAPLDYPTSPEGMQAVLQFVEKPLSPAAALPAPGTFKSFVYVDPALKPLSDESIIRFTASLTIKLNHNKVNATDEGERRYEYHVYTVNESLPYGATGFVPVTVTYKREYGI